MIEITFGTGNQAKIDQIQSVLPHGIKLIGLNNFKNLPKIEENGKTAQENARKKALTLAKAIGKPVLAIDNALYFKNIDDSEQPGINVRRIPGGSEYPTDREMLDYYINLISKYGGRIEGEWEYALVYAYPSGKIIEATISCPVSFVDRQSNKIVAGYPLDSISIDFFSSKYVSELSQKERLEARENTIGPGIRKFFEKIKKES